MFSLGSKHIRRLPAEMLAAIDADKLAGHAGRVQQVAERGGDIALVGPAAKHRRRALAGEMRVALTVTLKRGAGADGVDADAGGERLSRGARQRPQSHLGDGVGHELGRELAHALVDHVDDEAARRSEEHTSELQSLRRISYA